jgi:hypothetical protein
MLIGDAEPCKPMARDQVLAFHHWIGRAYNVLVGKPGSGARAARAERA